MLLIILQHLLLLHLKSIHGYFGLPQHIICTHPDQDMNYPPFITFSGASVWNSLPVNIQNAVKCQTVQKFIFEVVQKFGQILVLCNATQTKENI